MDSNGTESSRILCEIESLKSSKTEIDGHISELEFQLRQIHQNDAASSNGSCAPVPNGKSDFEHGLPPDMIYRTMVAFEHNFALANMEYGWKEGPVRGQANLFKSSILVVGAGGLGSPALLYLAASGVGRLGLVDHDVVELNNLHRQIIHTEDHIGRSKVESAAAAAAACCSINSTLQIVEHKEAVRTSNALEIMSKYDVVIDATDNVPSRYMISDCCVLLGKVMLCIRIGGGGAGSGLLYQVLHWDKKGSGVLGVVPGIIGCLQALEAIKVASIVGEPLSGRMLLFDALSARFCVVKIRGRSLQCEACGENGRLTRQHFQEFDYEKFTQSPLSTAPLKLNLLPTECRISSQEYNERIKNGEAHVLLDVRPSHHLKIVSLPKAMSIPLSTMENRFSEISMALKKEEGIGTGSGDGLYVICRRGK
ncbi:hypothetical protein RJ640_010101 [Escallonia rubra]|uniref:Rhodanese domain-containing protein n=1 Tax=Escallonia rubra TaxID=112253 RepID=A0AA88REI3_9ASTE|nr:hypothetical protein RJ640_010101 [Escallonia rubra]